jgi:hypothetical protein
MCDRCYCPHFEHQPAESVKAEPPRLEPDPYEHCRCLCPRGEHKGYPMLDRCGACDCGRFLTRLAETVEAETRLLNTALEWVFDAMSPAKPPNPTTQSPVRARYAGRAQTI